MTSHIQHLASGRDAIDDSLSRRSDLHGNEEVLEEKRSPVPNFLLEDFVAKDMPGPIFGAIQWARK